MARRTPEEMQAIYESDIGIIDTQADAKIEKLGIEYHKIEAKHLAALEKKRIEYDVARQKRKNRNEWLHADALRNTPSSSQAKIALINKRLENDNEEADLEYEQSVNASIEADMRVLDPIEERFTKAVEAVEGWRASEKRKESSQLERGTQRPRRR